MFTRLRKWKNRSMSYAVFLGVFWALVAWLAVVVALLKYTF